MALGDGIRRNIAMVSDAERTRFINAILQLDTAKFYPDGVSYWDKQEDIHKNAHFHNVDVHFGPAFTPWHRVIVNRLEELLREVDPALSLHYWDWTTDPRVAPPGGAALFTDVFMDNSNGDVSHLLKNFESSEGAELGNGHNKVWRNVGATAAKGDGTPNLAVDATILSNTDWPSFVTALKAAHDNTAHSYIGGTLTNPHYSFHDPFVFLVHSNLDRIWAQWQTQPGHPERMVPATAYAGLPPADATQLATELVEPWAGDTGLEPWASNPTIQAKVTYMDISVVTPPCYDTNGSDFHIVASENPFNSATNRFQIIFNDVPEEETTWRAAVVRVYSCMDSTIRVKPGSDVVAPFTIVFPPYGDVIAKHDPAGIHPYTDVEIWFSYKADLVGTAPQNIGPVNTTLECVETGQTFDFELRANSIHRQTVAVQLALDQSYSMTDPAGSSGLTRLQVLKDAASLFANVIQKNNGIGIIRFDDDAYPPNDPTYGALAISKINIDDFSDGVRIEALKQIGLHGAHGNTSIGDGLEMARNQLNTLPPGSYDQKAIIVLTDGLQNTLKSIEEVSDLIDDRTFAVGLGTETQVNTLELYNLTKGSGGYLLLSGLLSTDINDMFRMRKFFLQILASVTNTNIVKDPTGYINVGTKIKIPFPLTLADINCRVILLVDYPVVNLSVETPTGAIITMASAATFGATFNSQSGTTTCSFNLPLAFTHPPVHSGGWYVILEIDGVEYKRYSHMKEGNNGSSLYAKGARYCVSVHSYSNLRMQCRLDQSGMTPGSLMTLRASLKEYDLPVAHRAVVSAQVEEPDHSTTTLLLAEGDPGIFQAGMIASMSGIYRFRIVAEGADYKGVPFAREQILTGAVFQGGDQPKGGGDNGGISGSVRCCKLTLRMLWAILVVAILILLTLFFKR
jgi:hypothetical protein